MKGSFAEELYSESLKLSKLEVDPTPSVSNREIKETQEPGKDDFLDEDGLFWGGSDEELEKSSELDREWQRRRNQFHTIGYRDGLIAGKEEASQEGFNIGFKKSVSVGYKLGVVRGVTSVLALLPDSLKEKLIEKEEKRTGLQKLYETTHSLSTTDALRLFNDSIVAERNTEQADNAEASSFDEGDLSSQRADQNRLESYYEELQLLLHESPEMKVKLL